MIRSLLLSVCVLVVIAAAEQNGATSFTLATTVPKNPEVTVQVVYPLGADGKVDVEAASDIVYYQGWWGEKEFQKGGVYQAIAKARFTVVGIFFEDTPIDPATGSLDVIIEALARVRQMFGLEDRRAFACGHSSGASAVYWAAAAKPKLFEAIAPISGRVPEGLPVPETLMLHVFTWGDDRSVGGLAWHESLRASGLSTVLSTTPIWGARDNPIWLHLNSQPSITTAVAWLRAVADLRRASGGEVPPPAIWPVQADAAWVAATVEPSGGPTHRPLPSAALVDVFAAMHRDVSERDDAATGAHITVVRPRLPVDRTVVVLTPTMHRKRSTWDAALATERGALGIAISSIRPLSPDQLATLLAEPGLIPAGPSCSVIAGGDQVPALAGITDSAVRRIAIDPVQAGTEGILAVVAQEAAAPAKPGTIAVTMKGSNLELRHQKLLDAALASLAQQ
jgi:hypothetical protein